MDNPELILYRLEQQDKESARNRSEVKDALVQVANDALIYRNEIKASLGRVLDAVNKTNGRVTALEAVKFRMSGALWALGLVVTAVGAVVGWLVTLRGH